MSRRRWWIAAVLILALALSASLARRALPGLTRWLLVWRIEALTDRHVTIERLELDLTGGRLSVGGVRVADREPGPALAELERLDVRFHPRALLRGHLRVEEATLGGLRVRIVRTGRGGLNVSDLLGRRGARERPAAVTVDRFTLTDGAVTFEDRVFTPPRTWRAEGIAVEASGLSTVHPEPQGAARLTATIAGAPLSLDVSEVRLFPIHARIRLAVQQVDATPVQVYLPAATAVVLDRALLTAALTATLDARETIRLDGQGRLDTLVLRRRGTDAPLATVPSLAFTVKGADAPAGASRLHRLEVTGTATLFDARTSAATRFEIDRVRLVVEAGGADSRSARMSLTAGLPGGGELDAQGTVRLAPFGAALRTRVTKVDLAFWAPHVPLPVGLAGIVDSDLVVDLTRSGGLAARIRGRASVDGVAIDDGNRPLARARRVELTGVDLQWPRLRVERVRVIRPGAVVRRDREGRVPLAALLTSARPAAAPGAGPGPAPPGPAGAPAGLAVEIDEILLEDGRLRLDDAAVTPPARLRASAVRLTARHVTWPARRPAQLQFTAATPGGGTLEAGGTVSLDPVRVDLRARLAGAALAPYQSYVPLPARIQGRLDADLAVAGTLGRRVEVGVRGTAALSDLAFADGDRPLLTVARLETTGLDYTWPAKVTIDRFLVQTSWAMIERRPDGAIPLRALFTPVRRTPAGPGRESAPTGAAAPPAALDLTVRESVLEDGAATFVDGAVSPAARLDVAGVGLVAQHFGWPARGPVTVRLRAPMPGGGRLTAHGELGLPAPRLDLRVVVSGADIAPIQPYLPLRARVAGKAGADVQVRMTFDPLVIAARGTASLGDLAFADGDRPLLTVARLETTGLDYTWPANVTIDRLRVQKSWALIERGADGSFPLRALFTPVRSTPAGGPGREPAPRPAPAPVEVRVRRGVFEDGAATIVDGAVNPAARFEIGGAHLTVRDFAWPRGTADLVMRMPTSGGGRIEARGQLGLDTQSFDARVVLARADLAPAQPFLGVRASIAGKADADLRVKGSLAPLRVSVLGDAAVTDAALGDGQRPLVTVKRVDLAGVEADWPRRVTVERIGLQRPWSLIERDAGGGLPLLALLAPGAPAAGTTPAGVDRPDSAGPAGGPVTVEVGALAVEDGFVRFVDHTTAPRFVGEASQIVLTARGLGTAAATRSRVTLGTRLSGGAPLELSGEVGPLGGPLALDVQGTLSELALPRLNPYANRLLGWIARRGGVTARVHYRLVDDRLEASNEIVIGQPEFVPSRRGDAVRERVGVPLGLLVSLLKSSRGEVRLSLPITGNVRARRFDFGDAVWEAVRQTAIGVLALPVSWVGKIFYTEDARIETIRIWPVYFEPGTTALRRGFDKHAERLAGFLRDAPGVALTMKPVVTLDDIAALKREAVQGRIDALAREPGRPAAPAVAAQLYAARFPGRSVPPAVETIVDELAKEEPTPDAAVTALVARRVELVRDRLQARGDVNADRLRASEGAVPVEASGLGRVEFEIAP